MRVFHVTPTGRQTDRGEIFVGDVGRQTIVGEESTHFRLTEVAFKNGARNRPHVHATDQLLIVTEGEGIVAGGDGAEHAIVAGDIAFIPSGERHWHGARPGRDMTHLSVLGPGTTTIVG